MKKVFFVSKKSIYFLVQIIIVIFIFLCLCTLALLSEKYMIFLILLILSCLSFAIFVYLDRRGLYLRMMVDNKGMHIKNLTRNNAVLIPWENIESIEKQKTAYGIFLKIIAYDENNGMMKLYIKNSEKFLLAVKMLKVERGENSD